MTDGPPRPPDDRHAASLLRHDMVTPVNQILGYADLLIAEAEDQGRAYRAQSLRSIRSMGRRALAVIDDALIRDPSLGRPPDLAALAPGVVGPSAAIVEACRALEEASAQATDRASFLEDLGRVQDAAVILAEMARRASEGHVLKVNLK